MHHYPFNIGDYRKDTGHLSLLEHGIYRMLIDSYYENEGPLKADDERIMRTHCVRSADEVQAYKNVIADFFDEVDGHYINDGCDKVLQRIFEKSEKARQSAERRWNRKNKRLEGNRSERNANAMRTHSEGNANGMLPNTHNPIPSNNPPNPPRGEPDEPPGFEDFWASYPRKTGKGDARKRWKKLKPSQELQRKILWAVAQHKQSEQWKRESGKYIPLPATWLNQERWDDEPESESQRAAGGGFVV